MDNWEEIKTAYKVAVLGTVSAASEDLGVHRATVIRHIDSLEEKLAQKLFIRHTSGYTPTEAGKEIIRVVQVTDEQFALLSQKLQGQKAQLSGELIITSPEFLSPLILPAINTFHQQNPDIKTRYITTDKVLRLEYGEAHIAIRLGPQTKEPDNHILALDNYSVGLYASPSYIKQYGIPKNTDEFSHHYFLERENIKVCAPFETWLKKHVPNDNFVFKNKNPLILQMAVIEGIGIGFLPPDKVKQYPEMVEVFPQMEEWSIPISLVTHKDMHNTEKVQKLIKILWPHSNWRLG